MFPFLSIGKPINTNREQDKSYEQFYSVDLGNTEWYGSRELTSGFDSYNTAVRDTFEFFRRPTVKISLNELATGTDVERFRQHLYIPIKPLPQTVEIKIQTLTIRPKRIIIHRCRIKLMHEKQTSDYLYWDTPHVGTSIDDIILHSTEKRRTVLDLIPNQDTTVPLFFAIKTKEKAVFLLNSGIAFVVDDTLKSFPLDVNLIYEKGKVAGGECSLIFTISPWDKMGVKLSAN